MFYRGVAQAVLLFGSETWVLLVAMERKVEGTHTGFLIHITGNRALRIVDRTQNTPGAEAVQEAAVTHSAMICIWRQQATVVQWVALRLIFEVCTGEKGYEGGRA